MVSVTTRAAAADAALCTTSDSRRAEWEAWGMLPGGQQAAGAAALKGMHVREASLPPPISTAAAPSSPGIATPAISPTHAASTPTATVAAATDAAAALRAEASQQGDVAAAGSGAAPCDAALLRRRVQSFVQCVSRSPLVRRGEGGRQAVGGPWQRACPLKTLPYLKRPAAVPKEPTAVLKEPAASLPRRRRSSLRCCRWRRAARTPPRAPTPPPPPPSNGRWRSCWRCTSAPTSPAVGEGGGAAWCGGALRNALQRPLQGALQGALGAGVPCHALPRCAAPARRSCSARLPRGGGVWW